MSPPGPWQRPMGELSPVAKRRAPVKSPPPRMLTTDPSSNSGIRMSPSSAWPRAARTPATRTSDEHSATPDSTDSRRAIHPAYGSRPSEVKRRSRPARHGSVAAWIRTSGAVVMRHIMRAHRECTEGAPIMASRGLEPHRPVRLRARLLCTADHPVLARHLPLASPSTSEIVRGDLPCVESYRYSPPIDRSRWPQTLYLTVPA